MPGNSCRKLCSTFFLAAVIGRPAMAEELKLAIHDGRVTLIAQNVTVGEILAEWARLGQTRIVNAEKLAGPRVTLVLLDVSEDQALQTVLRSASGYVAAARRAGTPGGSGFDRILILASSQPPVPSAPRTAPPETAKEMEVSADRISEIHALADEEETVAAPALLAALSDPDPQIRQEAAEVLGDLGNDAYVDSLGRLSVTDENPEVRARAAAALARIGSPQALAAVRRALQDAEAKVRRAAVDALTDLGGARVLALLREALADRDEGVRRAAAQAIRGLEAGDRRRSPSLSEPSKPK